jgi:CRP/FNR family transcriptional regulator, cyclic AMP receptor protein
MGTLQERYEGVGGESRLLEGLKAQKLACRGADQAAWLRANGEICYASKGQVLIRQGDSDTDVFFILFGKLEIVVSGNPHQLREVGDHVGETAAQDPGQPRTATIRAAVECALWKLTDNRFREFLDTFPDSKTALSIEGDRRRTQRDAYIPPANDRPRVFIISATESLPVAKALKQLIACPNIDFDLWNEGVFKLSSYPLLDLEQIPA